MIQTNVKERVIYSSFTVVVIVRFYFTRRGTSSDFGTPVFEVLVTLQRNNPLRWRHIPPPS